jgi:hypothetical protein
MVGVAGACAATGVAAKPKLYSVALAGEVRSEATRVNEGVAFPPEGCFGVMSETHRFVASAGLAPKPGAAPVASYGRLKFKARLTSPAVAATTETPGGSFTPDPDLPPADPAVCVVAPETKSWACRFAAEATGRAGAEFALLPNKGRYEIYYNRSAGLVSCDDEFQLGVGVLDVGEPLPSTNLRVRAVKRLRKGRSASVSGTVMTPPDPGATGGETLQYTLRVKRVR